MKFIAGPKTSTTTDIAITLLLTHEEAVQLAVLLGRARGAGHEKEIVTLAQDIQFAIAKGLS